MSIVRPRGFVVARSRATRDEANGYTFNQAGLTFNQVGQTYGGVTREEPGSPKAARGLTGSIRPAGV